MIYIYALCEPTTGEIRYVGQSTDPRKRVHSHCHRTGATRVFRWTRRLAAHGQLPMLVILAECQTRDEAVAVETRFIAQLQRRRLLNERHPILMPHWVAA